jgi:GT2 family glycosyltransferase
VADVELSVTICSWNTREYLRACLASLELARSEGTIEVIVIDNASNDSSAEMVETEFPWVRLERLSNNVGFGAGHNLAFTRAKGDLIMPLNSDTEIHASAIRQLIAFMRENTDVGIVGPKLLNPDGSLQFSCRRFPTPSAMLFRNTPLGRLFPNNRFTRDYLMTDWSHDEPRDVDWVSGAAFCLRRELYDSVGGFDERFFMYLEDVDLCKRAHEAGYRVVYFPGAVITHAIGKSTDIVANTMIRQFHHSMWLFYCKHYLPKTLLPIRPFAILAARFVLWMRQSLFIIKNKLDDWKRKRGILR